MTQLKRHLYSAIVAFVFIILATASAKINKIHCGAFNRVPAGEITENKSYLELNDGKKIYGNNISWKSGLVVKDQVKIDDQSFKLKEARGYFQGGTYYGRVGSGFAKRIVHGKVNVYYTEEWTTNTDSRGRMTQRLVCLHYVQVGDKAPLKPLANQKDIKEIVQDCPKAVEMADKSNSQMRKAIRKDRNYLNSIFITYNNGCK